MSGAPSPDAEYLDPVALTQRLVRFDTTTPSGNEGECIAHIKSLVDGAGIQTQVLAKTPSRPNLLARLPGDGSAAPLLLQGHVDVVSALLAAGASRGARARIRDHLTRLGLVETIDFLCVA